MPAHDDDLNLYRDKANSEWLRELPPRRNGALLIAGDVSHNPLEVAAVIDMLVAKFRHVFYCVGVRRARNVSRRVM